MYFLSHFTLKTTNADNSNKTKTERKQLEKKINHKTKLVSEHIIILLHIIIDIHIDKEKKEICLCKFKEDCSSEIEKRRR